MSMRTWCELTFAFAARLANAFIPSEHESNMGGGITIS